MKNQRRLSFGFVILFGASPVASRKNAQNLEHQHRKSSQMTFSRCKSCRPDTKA